MSEEKKLLIVTAEPSDRNASGVRGNPYAPRKVIVQTVEVSAEVVREKMSDFVEMVGEMFDRAETRTGMILDEVELSVEITGEGEVKLMGTGIGLEGKGAITLKFKRDR
ncbi:hypothetical protein [Spirulina sp. 06S082]|uniref:Pepco domain-containing protein n=1 Tax=Spirulina sp. 06S082 TaxID=3110248 RepID=UPI002B2158CF|nr:hypothetical protein [Spirulina sp. 06S082]MEA5469768.1 hypothetical protein [Spirulina sp. 06S082]